MRYSQVVPPVIHVRDVVEGMHPRPLVSICGRQTSVGWKPLTWKRGAEVEVEVEPQRISGINICMQVLAQLVKGRARTWDESAFHVMRQQASLWTSVLNSPIWQQQRSLARLEEQSKTQVGLSVCCCMPRVLIVT